MIEFKGGSGGRVGIEFDSYFNEVCVIKEMDKPQRQMDWFKKYEHKYFDQMRIHPLKSAYTMPIIEGKGLHESRECIDSTKLAPALLNLIGDIKYKFQGYIDHDAPRFDTYIKRLNTHIETVKEIIDKHYVSDVFDTSLFDEIIGWLEEEENSFNSRISGCHGDLTFENIMIDSNKELIPIDPNFDPECYSSWLLDVSKLFQSCHSNYEDVFADVNTFYQSMNVPDDVFFNLRSLLSEEDYYLARLLELTHYIRMLKYKFAQSSDHFVLAFDRLEFVYKKFDKDFLC